MRGRVDKAQGILRVKADLLCMGLRPNEVAARIYARQNPCHDSKTGNVGLHVSLENGTHVLVTLSHRFDLSSPYHLEGSDDNLLLCREGGGIGVVKEVQMPAWYSRSTSTGVPMASVFLHEGGGFLHQAYSGCDYHARGLGCRYCGAGAKRRSATPLEVSETVAEAVNENSGYHVCLGGGTRLPARRNVEYFARCATQIRAKCPATPVWVEMVPPGSDEEIHELVAAGVTSFGFNIEIWDETLRMEVCPGKSQITRGRYLAAMEKARDLLGPNRVGSCLIVGLEPVESSIQGANELAALGVQPCLLPFKPWDGSAYSRRPPCAPDALIKVSRAAAEAMCRNALAPHENQGCLLCEGCTVDHDLYEQITGAERRQEHEDRCA